MFFGSETLGTAFEIHFGITAIQMQQTKINLFLIRKRDLADVHTVINVAIEWKKQY